jgi:hypothetical protein
MEDSHLSEKHHSNPAPLPLTDFCPEFNEKGLDITPLDIGADWMGKDGFQGSPVLSSHTENGTTRRYYPQAHKL